MSSPSAVLPDSVMPGYLSGLVFAACVIGAGALLAWPVILTPLQELCTMTNLVADSRCATGPNKLLGYLAMIAFFPAILGLERIWPASSSQHPFSRNVLIDFVWFCAAPLILIAVTIPVEDNLRWVYSDVLGLGVVPLMDRLPLWAQIVFVVLLSDFLAWCAHVLRHKSASVWQFHAIHHAQRELNYFSTSRIHPVDGLVVALVRFLPFTMLDAHIALPAFGIWISFERIYTMFTHSNVRTNLGFLRYLLVTPQSHRVHHSVRPEHKDKNFGNLLSIWDIMFGTQCWDFAVYPETGVEDQEVPDARRAAPGAALDTFAKQLVYPFKTLKRLFAGS